MPLPPPIGTNVPIVGNEGVVREGEEEGTVVQTPLFGSPGAPLVEQLTPMEIEERELMHVAEQDKEVPLGSL
eukprot:11173749-Lingulodinium_polyedra.AAC.1